MPRLVSDVFGTTHDKLLAAGAFDAFVDVDQDVFVGHGFLRVARRQQFAATSGGGKGCWLRAVGVLSPSQWFESPPYGGKGKYRYPPPPIAGAIMRDLTKPG